MDQKAGLRRHIDLGCHYRSLKQYDKAIEEFKRVLKTNPEYLEVDFHIGLCYYRKKDLFQAVTHFKQALKINPKEERIHESLGFCYLELKEIDSAIEEFGQILGINPDSQYGHLGLGFCYLEQRRIERAFDEFNQVLGLNLQNDHAYLGLGLCYKHNKQFDKAIDELRHALEISPDLEPVHQGLGEIYLEQRSYGLAQVEFEQSLQLNTDNIFSHQLLGCVYKRQAKDYLAVTEFIKATNLCLAKEKIDKGSVNNNDRKLSVKILRMPRFCNKGEIYSTELNTSLLPPLALGQIVAYLRAKGIKIDQDDLNMKIHYDNYYSDMSEDQIDISVFLDDDKISKYISGADDKYVDRIMENLERKSRFYGYNIILLSLPVMTSNSGGLLFTLALCKFLKKKYNPIMIAGAARQTIGLLNKYDCRYIDFVICSGGESALFKLLSELKNGPEIDGFSDSKIRENGKLIVGEAYPMLKPDFSGLPIDKYKYKGLKSTYKGECREILEEFNRSGTLLLPFKFIRGCPCECVFCPMSVDRSIYLSDPPLVALYLKELQGEYNPTGFFFLSDTINISRQYVDELCDEIIKNKTRILWSDCARADNLDRDLLFKMRKAGCIRLIFGIETASSSLLRYIKKGISIRRLENILRWSDEAGIWTGVEIICGLPHEKDSDIEETITFLNRNRNYINTIYINQFDLRDGSIFLPRAKDLGIENIFTVNQYANKEFSTFHKYGYDETDGLQWQCKRKQILSSYKKVSDNTCGNSKCPPYELEHLLFFLYNKFSDKQKVCDIFAKVETVKRDLLTTITKDEKVPILR